MSSIAQSSLPNKLDIPLRLSALLVLFAGVSLGLFTLSSAVGIWVDKKQSIQRCPRYEPSHSGNQLHNEAGHN